MTEGLMIASSRKSDKELADELKGRFVEALGPLLVVADEIKVQGFELRFQFGPDWAGRNAVTQLVLAKIY